MIPAALKMRGSNVHIADGHAHPTAQSLFDSQSAVEGARILEIRGKSENSRRIDLDTRRYARQRIREHQGIEDGRIGPAIDTDRRHSIIGEDTLKKICRSAGRIDAARDADDCYLAPADIPGETEPGLPHLHIVRNSGGLGKSGEGILRLRIPLSFPSQSGSHGDARGEIDAIFEERGHFLLRAFIDEIVSIYAGHGLTISADLAGNVIGE